MKFQVENDPKGYRVTFLDGGTVHVRYCTDEADLDYTVLTEFGCSPEDQIFYPLSPEAAFKAHYANTPPQAKPLFGGR